MSDWNETKENVKESIKAATKRIEELSDKAAMYIKIQRTENELDDLYARLGRLAFRKLQLGEDTQEEIATLLPTVQEKVRELDAIKDQYKNMK